MPIRPEMKDKYPKDWYLIRTRILGRAKNKCEWCGVPNEELGYRMEDGSFVTRPVIQTTAFQELVKGKKEIKIVLTVAHLDHTPENCHPKNLAALCQQCHNRYDAPMRAHGIRERKAEEVGQGKLFKS